MTARPPVFRTPRLGSRFARPDLDRPSAAKRGYGREWRAIRAAFLAKHSRCADCGTTASEVDHIISLRNGGTNEPSNLRALCKACHARKTVAVDGALGRKNLSGLSGGDPCPNPFRVSAKSMFQDEEG